MEEYSTNYIKSKIPISKILKYYNTQEKDKKVGSWWCPVHEEGGPSKGHKSPSLVAKDEKGIVTCMSKLCFNGDDIFGIIKKMENLKDFNEIKNRACQIGELENVIKDKKNNSITEITENHKKYLEKEGITKKSIDKYRLKSKGNYVIYPQEVEGETRGYKGISVKEKIGDKSKFFFEGEKNDLWPEKNLITDSELIIVEGEKDAIILSQELEKCNKDIKKKYSIVTLTTGAFTIPKSLKEVLTFYRFKKIWIIYDNDEAGKQGSIKLMNYIKAKNYEAKVLSLPENKPKGYDVSDYIKEGANFKNIIKLNELHEDYIDQVYPEKIYPERKKSFQFFGDNSTNIKSDNSKLYYSEEDYLVDLQRSYLNLSTSISLEGYNVTIPSSAITVIAAPTSHGKTLFLFNLVFDLIECNSETKVLYISLEESLLDITTKFLNLYSHTHFSEDNISYIKDLILKDRSGYLAKSGISFSEKQFFLKKNDFFNATLNKRLFLQYGLYDVETLSERIKSFSNTFHTNVVIIDYIQLISLSKSSTINNSRNEEVKIICQKLRSLCLSYGISIIVSSQFNRQVVDKEDISLVNLGESGDIERVSSLVLSLWKTNVKSGNNMNHKDSIEVKIIKNRNGPTSSTQILEIAPNLHKVYLKGIKEESLKISPVNHNTSNIDFDELISI